MPEPRFNLFVYGTLLPGGGYHARIERYLRGFSPGTIAGVLIDLGLYPALVPGEGRVRGGVLELDAAALPIIDEIEGYDPDGGISLYIRKQVQVEPDDAGVGGPLAAWTYEYGNPARIAHRPRLVVGHVNGQPLHAWKP